MTVLKFGGSSVRNAEMIRQVLAIVEPRLTEAPLLVSSAMGKTTDLLTEIATVAASGNKESVTRAIDGLVASHRAAATELTRGDNQRALLERIDTLTNDLRGLAQGISLIRECSARSLDALLSFGELLSTSIIAAAADDRGIPVTLVDARELIVSDDRFGAAGPDLTATLSQTRATLDSGPGRLIVTQGFIARTREGVTTTLGRGGSDYTASILGSVLQAEKVEIWTDVDGIMTADPRVIPAARTLPAISYQEAAELAYFGAKVVHPATMRPAIDRGIPIVVRNTGNPGHSGTTIGSRTPPAGVRAIASKSGITLITIESSRMLAAFGFLHALFEVFERHEVSVDLIATSEVSVSMTVERDANIGPLVEELRNLGTVSTESGKGIICVVGQGILRNAEFLTGLFASLGSVPVRMISLGSSDINLSLVVPEEQALSALQRLHAFAFPTS